MPTRNSTDIDTLLAPFPPEVRDLALAARDFLAQALPGAAETLDGPAKLIGYGYGPGYKGLVCTLLLSKTGMKLGIARGSELPDPKQLMQGSGKVHRHVQLRTRDDLNQSGLKPLLKAALAAWKKRNENNGYPRYWASAKQPDRPGTRNTPSSSGRAANGL
jgi:hypothetical protein